MSEGATVFVRNIPFAATEKDLAATLSQFGKVKFAKLVQNSEGDGHRGSGFVKFLDAQGAEKALQSENQAQEKIQDLLPSSRKKQKAMVGGTDALVPEGLGVSLQGRRLVIKRAVDPTKAGALAQDKKENKNPRKKEREKWAHLQSLGKIDPTSDAWNQLSKSEQELREASMRERKFQSGNPNFTMNPLRLSVRNLPRQVDANALRRAVVEHLVQDPEILGKSAQAKRRKQKEAEKLLESVKLIRDKERKDRTLAHRSRGFAFITFKDHKSALSSLHLLNNNNMVFGGNKRPIVEFVSDDTRKIFMQKQAQDQLQKKKEAAHGEGAENKAVDGQGPKKKFRKRTESRGKRQREKRRQEKAKAAAEGRELQQTSKSVDSAGKGKGKGKSKGKGKRKGKTYLEQALHEVGLNPSGPVSVKPKRNKRKAEEDGFDLEAQAMTKWRKMG